MALSSVSQTQLVLCISYHKNVPNSPVNSSFQDTQTHSLILAMQAFAYRSQSRGCSVKHWSLQLNADKAPISITNNTLCTILLKTPNPQHTQSMLTHKTAIMKRNHQLQTGFLHLTAEVPFQSPVASARRLLQQPGQ